MRAAGLPGTSLPKPLQLPGAAAVRLRQELWTHKNAVFGLGPMVHPIPFRISALASSLFSTLPQDTTLPSTTSAGVVITP